MREGVSLCLQVRLAAGACQHPPATPVVGTYEVSEDLLLLIPGSLS